MAYITINKSSFISNIRLIEKHLQHISPHRCIDIGAVLKDNAYGHGLEIMASLARDCGIKSVFVKNYDEAIRIHKLFECVTFFYGSAKDKIDNIYTSVHDIGDFDKIESIFGDTSNIGVELKINIGMNRNGIDSKDLEKSIEILLKKNMLLKGIFAHNGYGDDNDEEFYRQIDRFKEIKHRVQNLCNKLGLPMPRFHSLNSSSTLRVDSCDDSLVRIGIALYGYLTSSIDIKLAKHLKPILKLYANKISTKTLESGERIGYGGISVVKEKSKVSTYDIGYGDGLYRLNGNRRVFLPNGYEILPKTSMDCFSSYGDEVEVCVMDNASYIAEIFDTLPYEVLTRLSPFIERRVIQDP